MMTVVRALLHPLPPPPGDERAEETLQFLTHAQNKPYDCMESRGSLLEYLYP